MTKQGDLLTTEQLTIAVKDAERVKAWPAFDGERATLVLLARAVLHLRSVMAAPLPEELAEIERDAERGVDVWDPERILRLLAGVRAQAATIRERDAEIATMRAAASSASVDLVNAVKELDTAVTLAKAERALRQVERDMCIAFTEREVCGWLALDGACQDARVALRAAGGEP